MRTYSFFRPQYLGLLSTAIFGLVQFLSISLYPSLAVATGLGLSDVILCFTLGSLLFVWSSPFWSKLSDKWGRLKVLGIGHSGLCLSLLILILITRKNFSNADSFILLASARIFYGMTGGAIVSVVQAWWRDQEGNSTQQMISHSMALNMGRFLAPAFILLLSGELISILSTLCFLSFILSALCFTGPLTNPALKQTEKNDKKSILSMPLILAFFATSFIGVVHSLLAKKIQTIFGLDLIATTKVSSFVLLGSGVCVLSIQFCLKFFKNQSATFLLSTGTFSWLVFAVLLMNVQSAVGGAILIMFLSIGIATVTPGYLSLLRAGGRDAGAVGSVQTIGLCSGGFLGVIELRGFVTSSTVLMILSLLILSLVAKMFWRERGLYA